MSTIYDATRKYRDSADVYDGTYDDGGMGWVVEEDMREGDAYDKVVWMLAHAIEVTQDNGVYDVVADIAGYVEANIGLWEEFGKEFNHDRAQISDDEDGLYWGVTSIQQLANGLYADDAYEWLAERLCKEEEE